MPITAAGTTLETAAKVQALIDTGIADADDENNYYGVIVR